MTELVRRTYFLSKDFPADYTIKPGDQEYNGPIISRTDHPSDDFVKWLIKNSLSTDPDNIPFIHKSRLIIGENGGNYILCSRIIEEEPKFEFPNKKVKETTLPGTYKRVVRILSMPRSKDIPLELQAAFDERGYKPVIVDFLSKDTKGLAELVTKLEKAFYYQE